MKAGGSIVTFRKRRYDDRNGVGERFEDAALPTMETKKCRWLLDAGEGKEMDSFLEPLKGRGPAAPCRYPTETHFALLTPRTVR